MTKLTFNIVEPELTVIDLTGNVGYITHSEHDKHNVEVKYSNGGVGLYCIDEDCDNHDPLYLLNLNSSVYGAKPCPFCGGYELAYISDIDEGKRDKEFITCMNDKCFADGSIADSKKEALEKWNNRITNV